MVTFLLLPEELLSSFNEVWAFAWSDDHISSFQWKGRLFVTDTPSCYFRMTSMHSTCFLGGGVA